MSPALAAAIDAARELAWMPSANLPGSRLYHERKEAHERVVARVAGVRRLPPSASHELRYLLEAIRRAAAATYSNRTGLPYLERRQAVAQLRGCLDAWDRSIEWRAA